MSDLILLTDGSVDPKTKTGFGAYLLLHLGQESALSDLKKEIKVKRFEPTSSTQLELETLLWALEETPPIDGKLLIYTDCQNILRLPERRQRLESNDYQTKKQTAVAHAGLYQAFFKAIDKKSFDLVKIKGHKASTQKTAIDQIFSLVDKASRQALRQAKAG